MKLTGVASATAIAWLASSGSPTTDLMGSQAKELNNQQIADLGAYFASVNGQLKDLHDAN